MWKRFSKKASELQQIFQDRNNKLAEIKINLEKTFNEVTAAIKSASETAQELNTRLKDVEAEHKTGIAFVSHTGKLLFANKACIAIMQLQTKNRQIEKIYKQNGKGQTVANLAQAAFEKKHDNYFDIDITSDRFLFKEPVIIEFDNGEISKPVVLRVSLAESSPEDISDLIFICQVTAVSEVVLADITGAFKSTSCIAELEAARKAMLHA